MASCARRAGVPRRVRPFGEPVEAVVCMRAGGRVTLPETGEIRSLPWAE
ncbi:hypothetical protein [Thermostaphylospora chromogena]|nr:hypothetical protein [Thermostaphylospora chromogena]